MQLYSISFTTRKSIKKLDAKGNIISETPLDTPFTMHALPYATAMSYSGCDNFVIQNYQPDNRRGSSRAAGVGNGTKSVNWATKRDSAPATVKPKAKPAMTATQHAAATGNLAGALNV